jgi:hypothetical protein
MIGPLDRAKLARVLGKRGSANENEVAVAGRAAHRLMRDAGVSWEELLKSPPLPVMPDHRGLVIFCLSQRRLLTDWEDGFLRSLRTQARPFTPRQVELLERIAAKVERLARRAA